MGISETNIFPPNSLPTLSGSEEVALVSIKDNGTGIDPEIFPRLFEKFASKSFKGTGRIVYLQEHCRSSQRPKIIERRELHFTSHYRSYIVNDNKMSKMYTTNNDK